MRHLVFAIVSVAELCFIICGLLANRYAKFAMSAAVSPLNTDSAGNTIDALQTEDYQETLRYLRTLCRRMQIGAAGPTDLVGDDVWASWWTRASGSWMRTKRSTNSASRSSGSFMPYRNAPRCAPFMHHGCRYRPGGPAGSKTPTSEDRGYSRGRAVEEFWLALQDLAAALDLIEQLEPHPARPPLDEHESIKVYADAAAPAVPRPRFARDFRRRCMKKCWDEPASTRCGTVARHSEFRHWQARHRTFRPRSCANSWRYFCATRTSRRLPAKTSAKAARPTSISTTKPQQLLAELVGRQQPGAPFSMSSHADG